MSGLALLGVGIGAGIVILAVFAPRQQVSRSQPDRVNPIQQRARDYIASGAIPRWDS